MPIHPTGWTMRTTASTTYFGYAEPAPGFKIIGRHEVLLPTYSRSSQTIFEDEEVHVYGQLKTVLPPERTSVIVEAKRTTDTWQRIGRIIPASTPGGIEFSSPTVNPPVDTRSIRIVATEHFRIRSKIHYSSEYFVNVVRAPRVLTLIAMGGSWAAEAAGVVGVEADIELIDQSDCRVERGFVTELMAPRNARCKDLCANCLNFIEHLGLRILFEEGLGSRLESLTNKHDPAFCDLRTNSIGLRHTVILGKWENSEHEPIRPLGIKTFDDILDEFDDEGGGDVIIVGQSHGGAKLVDSIAHHWRWSSELRIRLFVAWDVTHFYGPIGSVGSRPGRVINFYQTRNPVRFQKGRSIEEADVEYDLTRCFSHNGLARSRFVHDKTYEEIRYAIADIRSEARSSS